MHVALIIALAVGLLSEFIGLCLIFIEAGRIRRRETAETTRLQRALDEIRFTWNNPAPQTLAPGSIDLVVEPGAGNLVAVPDDVRGVRDFLLQQLRAHQERVDERFLQAGEEMAQQVQLLQQQIDEIHDRGRTSILRAVKTERRGSTLVLVGFVLQAVVAII